MSGGDDTARRKPRLTAFRAGLATGVVLFLLAVGLFTWIAQSSPTPRYNVEVIAVGPDVSRHGGRKLSVENEQGTVLTQVCNGTCDDLLYRAASGDNAYRVEVLDASGGCITCGGGVYVTSGVISRWTLAGSAKLDGEGHDFLLQPDGSVITIEDSIRKSGGTPARKPTGTAPKP